MHSLAPMAYMPVRRLRNKNGCRLTGIVKQVKDGRIRGRRHNARMMRGTLFRSNEDALAMYKRLLFLSWASFFVEKEGPFCMESFIIILTLQISLLSKTVLLSI